jgi:hypothetical protein
MFVRKAKIVLAGILLILGVFVFLDSSGGGVTSLTVFEFGEGSRGESILGALIFLVGVVLLFMSRRKREEEGLEEVIVYDSSGGKSEDHDRFYILEDSASEVGGGRVSLGQFKRVVREYEEEEGGEELVKVVRRVYSFALRKVVDSGEAGKAEVAEAFLGALGEEVGRDESYRLGREEREEVKATFRGYEGGKPNKTQKDVMGKYGFRYVKGSGKHLDKFEHSETGASHIFFSSPSDWRSRKNLSSHLIKKIEEARELEAKKKEKEK